MARHWTREVHFAWPLEPSSTATGVISTVYTSGYCEMICNERAFGQVPYSPVKLLQEIVGAGDRKPPTSPGWPHTIGVRHKWILQQFVLSWREMFRHDMQISCRTKISPTRALEVDSQLDLDFEICQPEAASAVRLPQVQNLWSLPWKVP